MKNKKKKLLFLKHNLPSSITKIKKNNNTCLKSLLKKSVNFGNLKSSITGFNNLKSSATNINKNK